MIIFVDNGDEMVIKPLIYLSIHETIQIVIWVCSWVTTSVSSIFSLGFCNCDSGNTKCKFYFIEHNTCATKQSLGIIMNFGQDARRLIRGNS